MQEARKIKADVLGVPKLQLYYILFTSPRYIMELIGKGTSREDKEASICQIYLFSFIAFMGRIKLINQQVAIFAINIESNKAFLLVK